MFGPCLGAVAGLAQNHRAANEAGNVGARALVGHGVVGLAPEAVQQREAVSKGRAQLFQFGLQPVQMRGALRLARRHGDGLHGHFLNAARLHLAAFLQHHHARQAHRIQQYFQPAPRGFWGMGEHGAVAHRCDAQPGEAKPFPPRQRMRRLCRQVVRLRKRLIHFCGGGLTLQQVCRRLVRGAIEHHAQVVAQHRVHGAGFLAEIIHEVPNGIAQRIGRIRQQVIGGVQRMQGIVFRLPAGLVKGRVELLGQNQRRSAVHKVQANGYCGSAAYQARDDEQIAQGTGAFLSGHAALRVQEIETLRKGSRVARLTDWFSPATQLPAARPATYSRWRTV